MPAVWRCWEKRGGRPFGWWLGFSDVGELSGGWGGSPGPCPNLPGGGFSGAAPGRVLLRSRREKATAKVAQSKSALGEGRGAGFLPAPALGGKCEVFQGFCVFCGCPSVLHFSQINVLLSGLHFYALS